MKKIVYVLLCLFWLSCAKDSRNSKSEAVNYDMEISASEDKNDDQFMPTNYETLASQKLQEYFDLMQLQETHPEFKEDVLVQLKSLSQDANLSKKYINLDSVKNIRSIGDILKISDSVQKLKLEFDVMSKGKMTHDSIEALIITKTVMMDTDSITSNKIVFKTIH